MLSELHNYPGPSELQDYPGPSELQDYPVPQDYPGPAELGMTDTETLVDCPSPCLQLALIPKPGHDVWDVATEAQQETPSPKQAPPSPVSTMKHPATRPKPLEQATVEDQTKQPPEIVHADEPSATAEPSCKTVLDEPPELVPEATWKARLRRVFKPRRDGSYQVPSEFVDMYKTTDGQDKIYALFEKAQYDSAP